MRATPSLTPSHQLPLLSVINNRANFRGELVLHAAHHWVLKSTIAALTVPRAAGRTRLGYAVSGASARYRNLQWPSGGITGGGAGNLSGFGAKCHVYHRRGCGHLHREFVALDGPIARVEHVGEGAMPAIFQSAEHGGA